MVICSTNWQKFSQILNLASATMTYPTYTNTNVEDLLRKDGMMETVAFVTKGMKEFMAISSDKMETTISLIKYQFSLPQSFPNAIQIFLSLLSIIFVIS